MSGITSDKGSSGGSDSDEHTSNSQSDSSDDDADGADGEGDGRHSVKRSFLAKMLSPLLGYSSNFELLQFVYDLNLWTALGSKKNLGTGVPLRVLMKGHSFSPLYWKAVHNALIDLVRQVGLPKLFFTIAPLEQSFKYHEIILDRMQKLLRKRMYLPAEESMHIAHVLVEIVEGLLAGTFGECEGRVVRHVARTAGIARGH